MKRHAALACVLAAIMLMACGGHSRRPSALALSSLDGPYQQSLSSLPAALRAEVDSLMPPAGCNPALFNALKKLFVQALAARLGRGDKLVAVAPGGNGNVVHGLTTQQSGADFVLQWQYHNTGDYDQGGTVGITDITPIAMHFGHAVGTDGLDGVIHDVTPPAGAVGISDITPIAMNYGVNCDHYRAESSPDGVGTWTPLGDVPFAGGANGDIGWKQFQFTLPNADAQWLRVVPVDAQGNDGIPSDTLNFTGSVPPEIVSVSPTNGVANASVNFSAVVNGNGPFTYAWDFGGAATPATSSFSQPAETLASASGDYNCSLTVTNNAGEDTFDFTFTIGSPPDVSAVSPTSGVSGDSVQFTATVTGDAPITYAWDFAGGATPDTSTDESPVVTLGVEGNYTGASVSVTNAYGADFLDFNLNVGPIGQPPDITNAGPAQGHAGDTVTFTATVTGDPPFTYAWDFGSAATPNTSSDATPVETLSGTTGTYPISLVVTNAAGQDTYNFDIDIIPSGDYDEVEVNDTIPQANALPAFPVAGWHCQLTDTSDENDFFSFNASIGDHVDITMNLDSNDPDLDMALQDSSGNVLKTSASTTAQEHIAYDIAADGAYYIRCYFFGYTSLSAGDYRLDITSTPNSMDEVENNDALGEANALPFPLADFYGSVGAGGYDGDNDDYFAFNAASGDFLNFNLAQSGTTYNVDYDLLDMNGAVLKSATGTGQNDPMTYTFAPADQGPFYIHVKPTTNAGLYILSGTVGPSPFWQTHVIDNLTSADLGYYSSLAVTNDNLGAFYKDETNDDVCYAYSAEPDGMGLWNAYSIDTADAVGTWLNGGSIGGLPAVAYTGNSNISFAMCSTVDGSGTWYVSEVDPDGIDDPSVAQVNGYPALSYRHDNASVNDEPYFAINSSANGSGTWSLYPVDDVTPGGCYYTCLITLADGKPAISYYAVTATGVRFASCDAIGGNGTWTVTEVDAAGSAQTGAALVGGKPAVVYTNGGNPYYALNSNAQGTGTWTTRQISSTGTSGYKTLRVFNGVPVVAYMGSDSHIHYAVSTTADGLTSWTETQIVLNSRVGSNHALEWVNGKPAIVFQDTTDSWVGFATPAG